MVSVVFYNTTGLKRPEFRTDFNRLMSVAADYNYYTKPEHIDDVGTQILKEYFPQGGMETRDLNAVEVIFFLLALVCSERIRISRIYLRKYFIPNATFLGKNNHLLV